MIQWLLSALVGAATGVLSGFGVGGGTLLLVYMTAFAGLDQHLAQGINLVYFLPAGLLALPSHVRNGYLGKPILLPAIGAGLVCAALGAWAAFGMEVALLRRLFGAFLVAVGLWELLGNGEGQVRRTGPPRGHAPDPPSRRGGSAPPPSPEASGGSPVPREKRRWTDRPDG